MGYRGRLTLTMFMLCAACCVLPAAAAAASDDSAQCVTPVVAWETRFDIDLSLPRFFPDPFRLKDWSPRRTGGGGGRREGCLLRDYRDARMFPCVSIFQPASQQA